MTGEGRRLTRRRREFSKTKGRVRLGRGRVSGRAIEGIRDEIGSAMEGGGNLGG